MTLTPRGEKVAGAATLAALIPASVALLWMVAPNADATPPAQSTFTIHGSSVTVNGRVTEPVHFSEYRTPAGCDGQFTHCVPQVLVADRVINPGRFRHNTFTIAAPSCGWGQSDIYSGPLQPTIGPAGTAHLIAASLWRTPAPCTTPPTPTPTPTPTKGTHAPTPSHTPPATTTAPVRTPTPVHTTSRVTPTPSTPNLPNTGAGHVGALAGGGLAAVVAGAALTFAGRRRGEHS